MVSAPKAPANGFVKFTRKVYNPIGFSKGYNFVLFFIFAGALFGFTLARLKYLSFNGIFCPGTTSANGAAPGECYWYAMSRYRIGITLHLACILPAAILVILQFVPAIRHEALLYHRIAGYVIILLALLSIAGAIMIADRAFGGSLTTQAGVGLLGFGSVTGLVNSYYNIKKLQIDQHRAWMLRVWFWMGSIITLRLVQILATLIMTILPQQFYQTLSCSELLSIYNPSNPSSPSTTSTVYALYPACAPSGANYTVDGNVVVKANFNGGPENIGTALALSFPMALWIALVMHAVGVEIYLRLTPREAERLRTVSYQRQMEAGLTPPGHAGLVKEKLGDMEMWKPTITESS